MLNQCISRCELLFQKLKSVVWRYPFSLALSFLHINAFLCCWYFLFVYLSCFTCLSVACMYMKYVQHHINHILIDYCNIDCGCWCCNYCHYLLQYTFRNQYNDNSQFDDKFYKSQMSERDLFVFYVFIQIELDEKTKTKTKKEETKSTKMDFNWK